MIEGDVVDDVVIALQHQRREAIHDVKNIAGQAQNALTLYARDGKVRQLVVGLENTISRANAIVGRLES